MLPWWCWIAVGYLCGSIPFGLLIGKAHGVDIRKHGSGNVGATNTGRVLGARWGQLCFLLDVLKGLIPVLVAGMALGYIDEQRATGGGPSAGTLPFSPSTADSWRWLAIAASPMLGHVFPVWLKFKGGKGVATGLGVLLGMWPVLTLPGVAAGLTWAVMAALFRYVSLASVTAGVLLPVYVLIAARVHGRPLDEMLPYLIVTGLMALLVIVRHRTNIKRLIAGTEPKIGSRVRQPSL